MTKLKFNDIETAHDVKAYPYSQIIRYLYEKKRVNVAQMQEDFGLTFLQMNDVLNVLLESDIVRHEERLDYILNQDPSKYGQLADCIDNVIIEVAGKDLDDNNPTRLATISAYFDSKFDDNGVQNRAEKCSATVLYLYETLLENESKDVLEKNKDVLPTPLKTAFYKTLLNIFYAHINPLDNVTHSIVTLLNDLNKPVLDDILNRITKLYKKSSPLIRRYNKTSSESSQTLGKMHIHSDIAILLENLMANDAKRAVFIHLLGEYASVVLKEPAPDDSKAVKTALAFLKTNFRAILSRFEEDPEFFRYAMLYSSNWLTDVFVLSYNVIRDHKEFFRDIDEPCLDNFSFSNYKKYYSFVNELLTGVQENEEADEDEDLFPSIDWSIIPDVEWGDEDQKNEEDKYKNDRVDPDMDYDEDELFELFNDELDDFFGTSEDEIIGNEDNKDTSEEADKDETKQAATKKAIEQKKSELLNRAQDKIDEDKEDGDDNDEEDDEYDPEFETFILIHRYNGLVHKFHELSSEYDALMQNYSEGDEEKKKECLKKLEELRQKLNSLSDNLTEYDYDFDTDDEEDDDEEYEDEDEDEDEDDFDEYDEAESEDDPAFDEDEDDYLEQLEIEEAEKNENTFFLFKGLNFERVVQSANSLLNNNVNRRMFLRPTYNSFFLYSFSLSVNDLVKNAVKERVEGYIGAMELKRKMSQKDFDASKILETYSGVEKPQNIATVFHKLSDKNTDGDLTYNGMNAATAEKLKNSIREMALIENEIFDAEYKNVIKNLLKQIPDIDPITFTLFILESIMQLKVNVDITSTININDKNATALIDIFNKNLMGKSYEEIAEYIKSFRPEN